MRYGVLHTGKPVGTLDATAGDPGDAMLELVPAGHWVAESVELFLKAVQSLGYLGSVDDEGDRRGREAADAYHDFLQALELCDPDGSAASLAISTLFPPDSDGRLSAVLVRVDDDGSAQVPARLVPRPPASGAARPLPRDA